MNKKLTNKDISDNYRDNTFWFCKSTLLGKFAEWVVRQSPYDTPDIIKPLKAFNTYLETRFTRDMPESFTYKELSDFISEDVFENIADIEVLNHRKNGRDGMGFCSRYDKPEPDDDFIDLSALARNIFYSLCRENITEG